MISLPDLSSSVVIFVLRLVLGTNFMFIPNLRDVRYVRDFNRIRESGKVPSGSSK